MSEKMDSRQPAEGCSKAQTEGCTKSQNVTARRSRVYVEEEVTTIKHPVKNLESRTSSGDEMELETSKNGAHASQTEAEAAVFRSVAVDLGVDVSNLFPSRIEDRNKQVLSVLHGAKTSTKAKTDERPINFGKVIPGVYRSSFPVEEDFKYLHTLGLKTILSLVKKDFSPELEAFMKHNGIRHIVLDMQGTKKVEIPENIMHQIMATVLNKENHPILIHCNHGKHRTGCAVAVLRHVAGWNVDSIVEEYQGYAEPKIRECDVNYISRYEVSNLEGLFLKRTQSFRQQSLHRAQCVPNEKSERMARFIMFAAIVLSIWLTTWYCW